MFANTLNIFFTLVIIGLLLTLLWHVRKNSTSQVIKRKINSKKVNIEKNVLEAWSPLLTNEINLYYVVYMKHVQLLAFGNASFLFNNRLSHYFK